MWFFAILVVLVMGGVAALAAGRGTPMSDAYDDRPDALVPSGGLLRAEDVRRVRFSLAFRGYRMSEVDALLDRLAEQLDVPPARPPDPGDGTDAWRQEHVADTPTDPDVRGEGHAP